MTTKSYLIVDNEGKTRTVHDFSLPFPDLEEKEETYYHVVYDSINSNYHTFVNYPKEDLLKFSHGIDSTGYGRYRTVEEAKEWASAMEGNWLYSNIRIVKRTSFIRTEVVESY